MPRPSKPLYLHEEILLLALRDKKGTVEFGSNYVYAMCGGLLGELLLNGRITVQNAKKKLVDLASKKPFGHRSPSGTLGLGRRHRTARRSGRATVVE